MIRSKLLFVTPYDVNVVVGAEMIRNSILILFVADARLLFSHFVLCWQSIS